jgi:short-subunit dehydrogenase
MAEVGVKLVLTARRLERLEALKANLEARFQARG